MVDVGSKPATARECVARAEVRMAAGTLARILDGATPKGDVLATARVAGIQASKRTDEWIPLAHPLPLDAVEIRFRPASAREGEPARLLIEATARAHARTGVEMEALVAVTVAGLTIYDMCKAIDRGMTLEAVRLVRKTGGKSGSWERPGEPAVEEGA
jgi:cyclic pyranopterin phosphate synthase